MFRIEQFKNEQYYMDSAKLRKGKVNQMKEIVAFMYMLKEGYTKAMQPICEKYKLTYAELDVLLFLANNPEYDTATDIVEKRCIAKSHVSASIKSLEERNYIERFFQNNNRRTIHLKIQELAKEAIQEGKQAQEFFYEVVLASFSKQDREKMQENLRKMIGNMETYVGGKKTWN